MLLENKPSSQVSRRETKGSTVGDGRVHSTDRRHVVRSSHKRLGKACFVVEDPGEAKVSELHIVFAAEEDVCRL